MHCQECQQRPATLHFTKIINGEKNEFHICEQCAKEKGDFIPGSNSFSIHNLLSGLLNFEQPIGGTSSAPREQQQKQCPKCGLTYHQFTKIGRFGCAQCYETFGTKLTPIFKRIHGGNTTHSGKIPKRVGSDMLERKKIDQLKQHLQQLIVQEEFEEAAKVRDEIRSYEKRLDGGR
ncbi:UvrB/UvrC motif-containing protein [Alkalihalobacillus sp. AL-G]|uniref:UvrB/UvrC motif-containing protein n=1 Tax=Alkalihalobacillus sp. AL-G TaxID=2926399 RepID=UPI00272995BC|nr:UvrB/UvrC motif-containing protein [Alkalihalobacillus sp. AL-G]WLD93497.1 UvrB/UvrC motif-containing protein [Alkalihalobacillus sp. AL-G]